MFASFTKLLATLTPHNAVSKVTMVVESHSLLQEDLEGLNKFSSYSQGSHLTTESHLEE